MQKDFFLFSTSSSAFIVSHLFDDGIITGIKWYLILVSPVVSAEKAMAMHSSTLAWKIPWMEEPGRLRSMGGR